MSIPKGGARVAVLGLVAALVLGVAGPGGAQQAGPPAVPPSGGHTATALADGTVLVVSGGGASLFHPRDDRWSAAAPPAIPRSGHAAVLLPAGTALVTGGYPDAAATASAEVFDPASGRWTQVQPMAIARYDHTLTVLDDGTVLAAGGRAAGHGPFLPDVERYDPATDTWTPTTPMPLGRAFHTATKLADGRVLVTGGQGTPHDRSLRDAVVFDPASTRWTPVHQLMGVGRARHTATLLADGTVLIVGGTRQREGQTGSDLETSAELYDPQADSLTPTASLHVGRAGQAAISLPGRGVVVIAGEQATSGDDPVIADADAELYEPATRQWRQLRSPGKGAVSATGTLLATDCGPNCGKVLLVGAFGAVLYPLGAGSSEGSFANDGPARSGRGPLALLVIAAVLLCLLVVMWRRRRSQKRDTAAPAPTHDRSSAGVR